MVTDVGCSSSNGMRIDRTNLQIGEVTDELEVPRADKMSPTFRGRLGRPIVSD